MFTEHCADAIGEIVKPLTKGSVESFVLPKVHFRATAELRVVEAFCELNRRQLVVTGTEVHVCVLQTAFGLMSMGYEVFIVADAVSSRSDLDQDVAISRLSRAGANIVTAEMVLFEWLERGATEEFSRLLPTIKALMN